MFFCCQALSPIPYRIKVMIEINVSMSDQRGEQNRKDTKREESLRGFNGRQL